MKTTNKIASGENFTAVDFGKLSELNNYVLELGPDVKIPGKVFGGQAVGATGGEFSYQVFQPRQGTGFYHTHTSHEELYFFLSGKGQFQVDGQTFNVEEGSVVRIAPEGKRTVNNNGTTPLVMLCVQYRANTFAANDATDANILNEPVKF